MLHIDIHWFNHWFVNVIAFMVFVSCRSGSGSIEGIIIDAYTGKPIQGAEILINGKSQPVRTDSSGYFLIRNLSPDSVPVMFIKSGYQAKTIMGIEFRDSVNTYLETDLKPYVDWISSDTVAVKTISVNDLSIYFTDEKIQGSPDSVTGLSYRIKTIRLNKTKGYRAAIANEIAIDRKAKLAKTAKERGALLLLGRVLYDNPYSYWTKGKKSQYREGSSDYALFFPSPHNENRFILAKAENRSSFDMDIFTEAYPIIRNYIHEYRLPPQAAVRTEEFINYFSYDYPPPVNSDFSVVTMSKPSVLNKNLQLIRIGIQAKTSDIENRRPTQLTFVINVSGSVKANNQFGLLRKSLRFLTQQLQPEDKVSFLMYGAGRVILLEHTSNRDSILNAVQKIESGSTFDIGNLLREGYGQVVKYFDKEKINRVILCTDGSTSGGWTLTDELSKDIEAFHKQGITLTICGFGATSRQIYELRELATSGGWKLHIITDYNQAKRIFLEQLHREPWFVAKDVSAIAEFDKKTVNRYRLIGYEKWDLLEDEELMDYRRENQGIGLGHTITALYEVELKDAAAVDIGTIQLKWNSSGKETASELTESIRIKNPSIQEEEEFQLLMAVVLFNRMLRDGYRTGDETIDEVIRILKNISPRFRETHPDYSDFAEMVYRAKLIENSANIIYVTGK